MEVTRLQLMLFLQILTRIAERRLSFRDKKTGRFISWSEALDELVKINRRGIHTELYKRKYPRKKGGEQNN